MTLGALLILVQEYGPDLVKLVKNAIATNGSDAIVSNDLIEAERLKLLPAPEPIDE